MGILSPHANNLQNAWEAILDGSSGIVPLTAFDTSDFTTRFGGTIKNFDPAHWIPTKEIKKMDPFVHYGIVAGLEEWKDSGLRVTDSNRFQIGVAMGSGIGGIGTIEHQHDQFLANGPKRISPFFVPSSIINMISGHISIMLRLQGPNVSTVTACATGTLGMKPSTRAVCP
jgi:3-oxoacyl-[acyl-carrier-protein] synthase II